MVKHDFQAATQIRIINNQLNFLLLMHCYLVRLKENSTIGRFIPAWKTSQITVKPIQFWHGVSPSAHILILLAFGGQLLEEEYIWV